VVASSKYFGEGLLLAESSRIPIPTFVAFGHRDRAIVIWYLREGMLPPVFCEGPLTSKRVLKLARPAMEVGPKRSAHDLCLMLDYDAFHRAVIGITL